MRSFWGEIPLVRVALALMFGIGVAIAFGYNKFVLGLMLPAFAVALTTVFVSGLLKDPVLAFRLRYLMGTSLVVAIAATGYVLTCLNVQSNYSSHFTRFAEPGSGLIAGIEEPPVERDKVYTIIAEVRNVLNQGISVPTTGYIQLAFPKDSLSRELKYGDILAVRCKVDSFDEPKNPSEFNYKRYQVFHNIYEKGFVENGSWKKINSSGGDWFFSFVYRVRDSFLQVLRRHVKDKRDFGVASAIMLGYRDYVSGDIMRAYSGSGVVHILSVSGMHVAVMFMMLDFLLRGMDGRGRKWEIAKAFLIILFIWFYACLTGMSPPVLRSAMMFTFIQAGRVFARNVNIYNIIAGCAVLHLLINPFVIADVGFQLSYLAVIGIIYFYPKISALVPLKVPERPHFKKQGNIFSKILSWLHWLFIWCLDWAWRLAAVSLAAQIITLPLSLLYFYRMSNLFIISNLVVIPMSDLVLFSGTALFAFGHVYLLGDVFGWIFNFLVTWLDNFIFYIGRLPFALTSSLSINAVEMALLYLLIFLLCWSFMERKAKVLLASLVVVLALCSFNSYRAVRNSLRKELVVYCVPKERAIAFISGRNLVYDFDNGLWNDPDNMAFHIWHHWSDCRINSELPLQKGLPYQQLAFGKYVSFEGKGVLIIDSSIREDDIKGAKLKAEVVILSGSPGVDIAQLQKWFDFRELVFDSSNKHNTIMHWKKDCADLGIVYYDVEARGAFIYHF